MKVIKEINPANQVSNSDMLNVLGGAEANNNNAIKCNCSGSGNNTNEWWGCDCQGSSDNDNTSIACSCA